MPFNSIPAKDDLERAEKLVQKAIETRGVKIKLTEVPVPVPYGSAFEGEVVRKKDMRVEFGGKYSRAFEYLRMVPLEQVEDGHVEVIGPDFAGVEEGGYLDMGILIEVAGRKMQKDFEPVLERQGGYFVQGAPGVQHLGQAVPGAAFHRGEAEGDPFMQDGQQVFLPRPAIAADHGQVHRNTCFEAGVRQQHGHEFVLRDARTLGFEHDAHRLLVAGFVAHAVEHAEYQRLEVLLVLADILLAGARLRIGKRAGYKWRPCGARAGSCCPPAALWGAACGGPPAAGGAAARSWAAGSAAAPSRRGPLRPTGCRCR